MAWYVAGPITKEIIIGEVINAVGEHALDTVTPSYTVVAPPKVDESPGEDLIPHCMTQAPIPKPLRRAPHSIMVGLNRECPRWAPGSTIRWVAWKQGFKAPQDADYAAQHLNLACQKWNDLDVGVKFEWVKDTKDATFALCHGGDSEGVVASAFFPNANDLNMLLVYNPAFSVPVWKASLWKVFTHELGHVLGLRHEFALDINKETGKAYEAIKAVLLGPRNAKSVMTYSNRPPEIQASDVESTRQFYALRADAEGNPPLVGLTEVQDYEPM
ncbi:hypothetical protein QBC40DRAFT_306786 [Triangularia verruculosa]|uniref:Peptidase metallopeptidase domain-containing protein n=1 Tax=Triangularia verruculosa TaxID=2587418 RepID=A0AAN7AV04_9PEZI|nr:hypothetical protein QBC40DRAFT_306786 [Triangularia verruculosa]